MAEKPSYPQIPSTVWWGVRNLLKRSPSVTINERVIGTELNVQEAAARQYYAELKRVGLINDDSKATELGQKWRNDETYEESINEILKNNYPTELVQLFPPGAADRNKIASWFTRNGLGTGTAANKAATYMLISSPDPSDPPTKSNQKTQKSLPKDNSNRQTPTTSITKNKTTENKNTNNQHHSIPLNINVQIHISADATNTQIEAIFSAMRRYLYDEPGA